MRKNEAVKTVIPAKAGIHLAGFSFFEILIVLALLAILSAFAIPNFTRLRIHAQEASTAEALASALHFAREQALAYHEAVTISPDSEWSSGVTVTASSKVLRQDKFPTSKTMVITWKGSRGEQKIIFDEAGTAEGRNGQFFLDGKTGHWQILVNSAGRVRLLFLS